MNNQIYQLDQSFHQENKQQGKYSKQISQLSRESLFQLAYELQKQNYQLKQELSRNYNDKTAQQIQKFERERQQEVKFNQVYENFAKQVNKQIRAKSHLLKQLVVKKQLECGEELDIEKKAKQIQQSLEMSQYNKQIYIQRSLDPLKSRKTCDILQQLQEKTLQIIGK